MKSCLNIELVFSVFTLKKSFFSLLQVSILLIKYFKQMFQMDKLASLLPEEYLSFEPIN